jgi:hypothetical protein
MIFRDLFNKKSPFVATTIISGLMLLTFCKKDEPCPSVSRADAGENQSVVGTSATLSGNVPEIGVGIWDIVSGEGGVIVEASDAHSVFTGSPDIQYTLRWTITGCKSNYDDVVISFSDGVNTLLKKLYLNGQLDKEYFYDENAYLIGKLAYLPSGTIQAEYTYTYDASGKLESQAISSPDFPTVQTKYIYHPGGQLNYTIIDEGTTNQSKTAYSFQDSRIAQITVYSGFPASETGKLELEYQDDGYTDKYYTYPYSLNPADPASPRNPPARTIVKTFFTDYPVPEDSRPQDVIMVDHYLPWAYIKSFNNQTDDTYNFSVVYEFDEFDRVTKATYEFNPASGLPQQVYTYEY